MMDEEAIPLEDVVRREIELALGLMADVLLTRVNSGTARSFDGKRVIKLAPPGTADYLACVAGRYLELEVKKADGAQRKKQKDRQAAVKARSGVYAVVRSAAEAVAVVVAVREGAR